jgi:tetratricopeptide (TPR) repeat protein
MRIRSHRKSSFVGETAVGHPLTGLTSSLLFVFVALFVASFHGSIAAAQYPGPATQSTATTQDVQPKSIDDTYDRIWVRDGLKTAPSQQKPAKGDESCLLPPLNLVRTSVVSATALALPPKAMEKYSAACAALKKQKTAGAEKLLRKAVQEYPKYSLAWVTLGQVLAVQNHSEEARSACVQSSTVEPNYVPAYLCLADLAAQAKEWDNVLQFSNRAIQLDPISNAIAYEYNSAAYFRMKKLDAAEKSALRALEIDKNNSDPRVHFLLAQIYEAKGDRSNEVAQLREYLKFASNSDDVAMVKKYLAQIEESPASTGNLAAQKAVGTVAPSNEPAAHVDEESKITTARTASPENAAASELPRQSAPDEMLSSCNLDKVLPQIEGRVQEFVENVQRFTATESLEQESFRGSGQRTRSERWDYNYVVSIEDSVPGILGVKEYQNSNSTETAHPDVVTKGLPALLLIFHPYYAGDFSMSCEGLTSLNGKRTWQVRYRQRDDKPGRIRSYQIGPAGPAYALGLEGRAWFREDNFQIVKLESDLIKPIPEIQLIVDHTSAEYGPVHFQSRGIDIWLPLTVDFRCERKGKRIHESIAFRDYLLFTVDNKQEVSSPKMPEQTTDSRLPEKQDWLNPRQPFTDDVVLNLPISPGPD